MRNSDRQSTVREIDRNCLTSRFVERKRSVASLFHLIFTKIDMKTLGGVERKILDHHLRHINRTVGLDFFKETITKILGTTMRFSTKNAKN
jgi:hypothetical protein